MFEREIKFIYDFNLNKVKKTGTFLTYEQLLAADLHPAIMQYISAEIDFLIFEDRQKMLKNSVFDYSGGKITHYFNLVGQEVKKNKRFSTEYISKLILHASSFTVNFLIRPKWSLLKFIFDEDEHKTSVEIKQILNYLYYYGYIKNILISYLDKKKILSMNKDEFAELLDKIEKLGIETYLDDVINTALKSMAEFFNIGTTQKSKIPLPGLQIFLKEKKLSNHINCLEENFGNDEKVNYEIADIQKIFLNIDPKKDEIFEEIVEDDIDSPKPKLHEEIVEILEEDLPNVDVEEPEPEKVEESKSENEEVSEPESEIQSIEFSKPILIDVDENKNDAVEAETLIEDNLNIMEELNSASDDNEDKDKDEDDDMGKDQDIEESELVEIDSQYVDEKIETESFEEIIEEKISAGIQKKEVKDNELPKEYESDNSKELIEKDEPDLFGDDEFEEPVGKSENKSEPSVIHSEKTEINGTTLIDMSEILENKNMTKIIENIFDYDMEDFANTIDLISECPTKAEAILLVNELFENNNIKPNSKEAETFKSIISEYFDKVE